MFVPDEMEAGEHLASSHDITLGMAFMGMALIWRRETVI
jgi:hypothetical protein